MIARLAGPMLVLAILAAPGFAQGAAIRFSNWEFTPPPMTKLAERTADRLVLKLDPSVPGAGGSITLRAGQRTGSGPAASLDTEWKQLTRGRRLLAAEPDEQVELADGTKGLKRSAPTAAGGHISLTVYTVPGGVNFLVLDAGDEVATQVLGGASLAFFMSLRLHPVDAGADAPVAAARDRIPDLKPRPLGPDPYDRIDWKRPEVLMLTSLDLEEIELRSALGDFVTKNSYLLGGVVQKRVSFANAIDTAKAAVRMSAREKHVDALRRHPKLQDRGRLVDSAAAMMLRGGPGEALTRLLVAYERWPRDPEVLFNIAALLAQGRLANESLAILDEMERRKSRHSIGFGIQPQSGMDYLRAYNLMRLGRFPDADALIGKVVKGEPQFAEAALVAALLAHKLGRKPITFYVLGYYRRPGGHMKTPGREQQRETKPESPPTEARAEPEQESESIGDDSSVVLSAVHYVDVSRGKPGKLPPIYQPTTIEDALKFRAWYRSRIAAHQAELEALDAKSRRLGDRWRNKIPSGPRYEYYEETLRMFSAANARMPEIQRLLRQRNRAIADSTEAGKRFHDWFMEKHLRIMERNKMDMGKACPGIEALVLETHDSLRVHVQAVDIATRRLHRLWHRYATALGTIVGDPDFRAYLAHEINFASQTTYWSLIANMLESTAYAEYAKECLAGASARDWAKNVEDSELAPCDDGVTAALGFTSGPVTVGFSCDAITLGIEIDVGPVEVSGEATVDQTGKVTERKAAGKFKLTVVEVSGETSRGASGERVHKFGAEGGLPFLTGKAEATTDDRGSTSFYAGGKAGLGASAAGVEAGASQESGVVVTVKGGSVADVALRSTTSARAGVGGASLNYSETRTMSLLPTPSR